MRAMCWARRDRQRLLVPHDAELLTRPVHLLHHQHGSGDFLGLSPPDVRPLRGVPGTVVYDRPRTVIKRHVAPGVAVPLHPEAAAFAEHYGYTIDVLAAYRPTGKGRVERR